MYVCVFFCVTSATRKRRKQRRARVRAWHSLEIAALSVHSHNKGTRGCRVGATVSPLEISDMRC